MDMALFRGELTGCTAPAAWPSDEGITGEISSCFVFTQRDDDNDTKEMKKRKKKNTSNGHDGQCAQSC